MSCIKPAMNASSPGSCQSSVASCRAATARVSVVRQYHCELLGRHFGKQLVRQAESEHQQLAAA